MNRLVGAPVLAHASATPALAPLPLLLLVVMGAVAAVATLVARQSAVTQGSGLFLPSVPAQVAGHGWSLRWIGQALGLAGAAALVMTAALGAPAPAARMTHLALSDLWAWVAVLSLLFGPVWRLVNPLRPLAAALLRVSGDPAGETVRALPATLGWWPAAAGLLATGWVALVLPGRPIALLSLLAVLLLAHLGGVAVFGDRWLDRGDPIEAYSAMLGALAPIGRGAGGTLHVGSPRHRLATLPDVPGTAALVSALVAWYATDAIVETEAWHASVFPAGTWGLSRTLVLLACAAVVGMLAAWATGRHGLTPALLPIAAGWALGHHLAPLAPALGLVGLAAGHLFAIVVAHDRAVLRYGAQAPAALLEFRALVVVLLVAGLTLRFGGL